LISRIQHFRTTKMMRPWYEFSYRLIGKRPGAVIRSNYENINIVNRIINFFNNKC